MKDSIEINCIVPVTLAETVTAVCWAHDCCGLEESDAGPASTLVRAYFAPSAQTAALQNYLQELGATDIAIKNIAHQDWNASWRETIQPVRLTRDTWVAPTWRQPPLAPGERWIKIEPKMAFGTGHHETTRLAAAGILGAIDARGTGGTLLDIGTGSGVLCFCARQHGLAHCVGIEIDHDCRENLAENLRDNAGPGSVGLLVGTLDALKKNILFDIVVMNMIYNESAPLLATVRGATVAGGVLVWSGILVEGRDEALAAAARNGFSLVSEKTENEWWSGVFRAK